MKPIKKNKSIWYYKSWYYNCRPKYPLAGWWYNDLEIPLEKPMKANEEYLDLLKETFSVFQDLLPPKEVSRLSLYSYTIKDQQVNRVSLSNLPPFKRDVRSFEDVIKKYTERLKLARELYPDIQIIFHDSNIECSIIARDESGRKHSVPPDTTARDEFSMYPAAIAIFGRDKLTRKTTIDGSHFWIQRYSVGIRVDCDIWYPQSSYYITEGISNQILAAKNGPRLTSRLLELEKKLGVSLEEHDDALLRDKYQVTPNGFVPINP